MSSVTMNFSGAYSGFPLTAENGNRVIATVPIGCNLRVSTNLSDWSVVSERDFQHAGSTASYRIDCDSFMAPVTAILDITPA